MNYDEKINMSLLYDFYGDILTDRQKEIASLSFDEDLSLREISEITGITPQGVRDSLNKCKAILSDMEKKNYIHRIRSDKDKRQIFIGLTEEGLRAYREEHQNITAILLALVDDLGEETVLKAADSVDQIVTSLKKIALP